MSHSVQKHVVAPITMDLKAKLDVLAKTHFIGYNTQARSYQVQPYYLNKPK